MTRATVAPLHRSHLFILSSLFLLALVPRLFGANTVGWGWDQPRSFSLVNFDEGGSCRAALDGFGYSSDEFFAQGYGGNGTGSGTSIWRGSVTPGVLKKWSV